MTMQTIGVIGAGQMGSGIANVSTTAVHDVPLNEVSQATLGATIKRIEKTTARPVAKGTMAGSTREAALTRIYIRFG